MIQLTAMTPAERQYMAQRMPRTFRKMSASSMGGGGQSTSKKKRNPNEVQIANINRKIDMIDKCIEELENEKAGLQDEVDSLNASHVTNSQIIKNNLFRVSSVSWGDIISISRYKRVMDVRQAAMYLFRKHTKLSFPQIGRIFGGRDHSTVCHACAKVSKNLDQYLYIIEPIEFAIATHGAK